MLTAHGIQILFALGFAGLVGAVPAFALGYWFRGVSR